MNDTSCYFTMVPSDSGLTRSPDFPRSTYLSRAVRAWFMGLSMVSFIRARHESVEDYCVEGTVRSFREKAGRNGLKRRNGEARSKVEFLR